MTNIYDYLKELTKIDIEVSDMITGKDFILKSYVKQLNNDSILIDPPVINGTVNALEVGQLVKLSIKCKDGVYTALSSVIGKDLSAFSGILIAYPTNAKFEQKREFVRVQMQVNVTLAIKSSYNTQEENLLNVITADISGNGFSYLSDEPLGQYYSISSKIYLFKDDAPIECDCDHIHSKKIVTARNETKYKNAFMFTNMEKNINERLIKEIFKFQLEERKKWFK